MMIMVMMVMMRPTVSFVWENKKHAYKSLDIRSERKRKGRKGEGKGGRGRGREEEGGGREKKEEGRYEKKEGTGERRGKGGR